MPPRDCSLSKSLIAKPSSRIILPINQEIYSQMIEDYQMYREYLDVMMQECPELFPPDMSNGFTWHDILASKKMPDVRLRRIKLKSVDNEGKAQIFTIVPSFVMPYMSGYTNEVEKALFLRRFGVPYWGITYVFGKNDMHWERHVERLGRYDLLGTTIKSKHDLPSDVLADEKHTRINGKKAYIATTVAEDCVLGVSIAN